MTTLQIHKINFYTEYERQCVLDIDGKTVYVLFYMINKNTHYCGFVFSNIIYSSFGKVTEKFSRRNLLTAIHIYFYILYNNATNGV